MDPLTEEEDWEDEVDEDWNDWVEDQAEDLTALCIFCGTLSESPKKAFNHCKEKHEFDILALKSLNFYDCVKLLSYIRIQGKNMNTFNELNISDRSHPLFNDETYMTSLDSEDTPYFKNLLCWNGLHDPDDDENDAIEQTSNQYLELQERLVEQQKLIERLISVDMDEVGNRNEPDEEDVGYFEGYSSFHIHEEMLKDAVRTEGYMNFILKNKSLFEDKVVLDVGCGTGVLSIFACKAGARKVIGIDNSEMLRTASKIMKVNQLEDRIQLIKGKVEDLNQDRIEKVDIIISEWMGYFLFFESMLDTVLYARDQWLKPGGSVYPRIAKLLMGAASAKDLYKEKIDYWSNVYGCNMEPMKELVFKEPLIQWTTKDDLMSDPCVLKRVDINTVVVSDLEFRSPFKVTATRDDMFNAFIAYFDIDFDEQCAEPVSFSTGPQNEPTHWKQTVFLLEKPVDLKEGDVVEGWLSCKPNKTWHRSLDVAINYSINGTPAIEQTYYLG